MPVRKLQTVKEHTHTDIHTHIELYELHYTHTHRDTNTHTLTHRATYITICNEVDVEGHKNFRMPFYRHMAKSTTTKSGLVLGPVTRQR